MPEPEVHPAALPNTLDADQLRVRSHGTGSVTIDPESAGWRYLSFRVRRLAEHGTEALDPALEHAVVVIAGTGVVVESGAAAGLEVGGRSSPFDGLPEACYVPAGVGGWVRHADASTATLVAIASAPPSRRDGVSRSPVPIRRGDIRVEVRGAGNATRQINHIIAPDFPADRLEVVEVLTPSGNWSSWPPHKHDVDDMPAEAVLEEVYFYQFKRAAAWGLQRLYRQDRSRDCTWEVRGGDVVLVTDGYHPFVAAHGDDAYYLNALAGDRRTMACSFDPDLEWVRSEWAEMKPDARVPLVGR